jgi:Na+-driven multidrug efflux pump
VIFIRGLGPIPAFGTTGAAMGTVIASGLLSLVAAHRLFLSHKWVVHFPRDMSWKPDFAIIRSLFRFGVPTGIQGIAMNVGGVVLLGFVGSLQQSGQAQAAFAVGYGQLFSLITWTSVGLMGAAAAVAGQNLGAGKPERSVQGVRVAAWIGLGVAVAMGALFLSIPRALLSVFGMDDPVVVDIAVQLLAYLSVSGIFVTGALTYTGGLQGTGDTKSPLYISIISQVIVPIGLCTVVEAMGHLDAGDIWLAIVLGHMTRSVLSILRFRQGRWRHIEVDITSKA